MPVQIMNSVRRPSFLLPFLFPLLVNLFGSQLYLACSKSKQSRYIHVYLPSIEFQNVLIAGLSGTACNNRKGCYIYVDLPSIEFQNVLIAGLSGTACNNRKGCYIYVDLSVLALNTYFSQFDAQQCLVCILWCFVLFLFSILLLYLSLRCLLQDMHAQAVPYVMCKGEWKLVDLIFL